MAKEPENGDGWDEWVSAVGAALSVPVEDDPIDPVLLLTSHVAHHAQRAMAPVTAYLVGVAVGRGASLTEAIAAVDALLGLGRSE